MNFTKNCGNAFTYQQILEYVLHTITPHFDHIVVAIEQSKDLARISVDELQSCLETHERRLKERKCVKV